MKNEKSSLVDISKHDQFISVWNLIYKEKIPIEKIATVIRKVGVYTLNEGGDYVRAHRNDSDSEKTVEFILAALVSWSNIFREKITNVEDQHYYYTEIAPEEYWELTSFGWQCNDVPDFEKVDDASSDILNVLTLLKYLVAFRYGAINYEQLRGSEFNIPVSKIEADITVTGLEITARTLRTYFKKEENLRPKFQTNHLVYNVIKCLLYQWKFENTNDLEQSKQKAIAYFEDLSKTNSQALSELAIELSEKCNRYISEQVLISFLCRSKWKPKLSKQSNPSLSSFS